MIFRIFLYRDDLQKKNNNNKTVSFIVIIVLSSLVYTYFSTISGPHGF